jgi:hypothetical protein
MIEITVDTNIDISAKLFDPRTYNDDNQEYRELLIRQADCFARYGDIVACQRLPVQ